MSRCICCCGNRAGSASKVSDAVPVTEADGPMSYSKLTDEDRRLIKESSEVVFNKMHLENKGVHFLIGFFKKNPHHQKSFKAFRNVPPDDLQNLPEATNHGRKVMDQIALVVVHIDEPDAMQAQLRGLRGRHRKRRVHVRQMRDMLMAFVDFVRLEMGSKFTVQVEDTWTKLISVVVGILEEGDEEPTEPQAGGDGEGAEDEHKSPLPNNEAKTDSTAPKEEDINENSVPKEEDLNENSVPKEEGGTNETNENSVTKEEGTNENSVTKEEGTNENSVTKEEDTNENSVTKEEGTNDNVTTEEGTNEKPVPKDENSESSCPKEDHDVALESHAANEIQQQQQTTAAAEHSVEEATSSHATGLDDVTVKITSGNGDVIAVAAHDSNSKNNGTVPGESDPMEIDRV